ncbi:hypothetical protein [Stenotrophomonas indicatrix]|uniref:Uncharacterized protein n=1 Tax=Stenotrophomonas indicatrix TaxID=2045451 RepID=A0ABT8QG48_9GAMM|nr:hypothetical protein [Stenotrophomonas indicatrix]MDN8662393.1 hypothetical protein [Stenotrophomonas indicatrix]MDN8670273.1 hypothetical protein [Stenotrophomonas indicatrix]
MSNASPTTTVIDPSVENASGAAVAHAALPSASRQQLAELSQRLAETSDRKRTILAKADTLRRAGDAAKDDASRVRQEWSNKLREGNGTLTRQIQKLRATERSALSLAEEYDALADDVSSSLPSLELELAGIADTCIQLRNGVFKEAAPLALEEVMAQAGDGLAVAFSLFVASANASVHHTHASTDDVLAEKFSALLSRAIRARSSTPAVHELIRQQLALPALDLSQVDMSLVESPAMRSRARQELLREVAA